MEKHLEVKGVRDGKAHCTCGWESSFGGKFADHVNQFKNEWLAKKLEELNEGLSWLGAQGNTPVKDTAWGGVTACMDIIKRQIRELRGVEEPKPVTLTQKSRTRHLVTTEFKETYSFLCSCGKPVYLSYNGGELDSSTCSCGVYWELESPVVEIWSTPKR